MAILYNKVRPKRVSMRTQEEFAARKHHCKPDVVAVMPMTPAVRKMIALSVRPAWTTQ